MGMKQEKIKFIINPISGVGRQKIVEKLVEEMIDKVKYLYDISYTEAPHHATFLAQQASKNGYDVVVAVGGDGSINEVAKGIIGSQTKLAIIPTGSGNGLARHLQIPFDIKKAIQVINFGKEKLIDTAVINENLFLNVAGVGFDAKIANEFAKCKKRGFWSYFKVGVSNYFGYKEKKYTIYANGNVYKRRALFISLANSDQFGFNTSIAPSATIDDGELELCIMRKPGLLTIPFVFSKIYTKRIHTSRYYEVLKVKEAQIVRKKRNTIHVDGDPMKTSNILDIKVNPKSLNVIIP